MERKWTKEPWAVDVYDKCIVDEHGMAVFGFARGKETKNASMDRAVCCVNALRDIPNPAAFVEAARELAIKTRNLAHRMEVNELVGKTDSLGLADQKAYDECREAYEAFRAAVGAEKGAGK